MILELNNVAFSYEKQPEKQPKKQIEKQAEKQSSVFSVFDNLTLSVSKGEFVVLETPDLGVGVPETVAVLLFLTATDLLTASAVW